MDSMTTENRPPARIAGLFYLSNFLAGGIAVGPSTRLFVAGNAAATAANIIAHPSLYWTGFAGFILMAATYIAVTALFYQLFRPVNKDLSVMAAFFSIIGCAIVAISAAFYAAPSLMLTGQFANAFSTVQVQAQSYMFLRLFTECFNMSFVFFGFYMSIVGWLAYKSTFLPPILGILVMIAGIEGLTFLSPPFVAMLKPWILAGSIGEVTLTLWLIFRGVNTDRWIEMARS